MPTLLFVNACVQTEQESRTHQLCRSFLDEFRLHHPDWTIDTVDLPNMDLRPFNGAMRREREAIYAKGGQLQEPLFDLAWQFAAADKILVGAPYWDLSFPSILKVYVEHVSVCGATFVYEDDWLRGICKADSLMYITTAGGPLENANYGYDFFRGLCRQFGIGCCRLVSADRLDMEATDVGVALSHAADRAREEAKIF